VAYNDLMLEIGIYIRVVLNKLDWCSVLFICGVELL